MKCPPKCKVSKLSPELQRLVNDLLSDRSPPQMILASLDSRQPNHGISSLNLWRHGRHAGIVQVPLDSPVVSENRAALAIVLKLVDPLKEIRSHEEFSKAVQILDRDIEYLSAIPVAQRTPFQNRHLLQAMAEKRLWVMLGSNLPHLFQKVDASFTTNIEAEIERLKRETQK